MLTFVTFETMSGQLTFAGVIPLRNIWILSKPYKDVPHINISDEYNVDRSVTFTTFQTRSGQLILFAQQFFKECLDPFKILFGCSPCEYLRQI